MDSKFRQVLENKTLSQDGPCGGFNEDSFPQEQAAVEAVPVVSEKKLEERAKQSLLSGSGTLGSATIKLRVVQLREKELHIGISGEGTVPDISVNVDSVTAEGTRHLAFPRGPWEKHAVHEP